VTASHVLCIAINRSATAAPVTKNKAAPGYTKVSKAEIAKTAYVIVGRITWKN